MRGRTRWAVAATVLVATGLAIATFVPLGVHPPTVLQMGSIEFRLQIPPDWEVLDYGARRELRNGPDGISIELLASPYLDLEVAADRVLEKTMGDGRREVATRDATEIDGRPALAIKTWDRWSHLYPERFLLVKHASGALVLATMQGAFERTEPVLEGLVGSLDFADSLGSGRKSP